MRNFDELRTRLKAKVSRLSSRGIPRASSVSGYTWADWGASCWLVSVMGFGAELAVQTKLHLPPGIDPTLIMGSMTAAYALALPLKGKPEGSFVRAVGITINLSGGAIASLILSVIGMAVAFHADLPAADRSAAVAAISVLCALFGQLALFSTLMCLALSQIRQIRPAG